MRSADVPLFSLEQHFPARDFDVLAFNLSAELVYTNVLNLIDLAGVPIHGVDRSFDDPIVVAGGHCAFNPEPLADFVDCFVLGDGEEAVGELNEAIAAARPRRRRAPETAGRGRGSGCCGPWPRCPGSTSRTVTRPATGRGRRRRPGPGSGTLPPSGVGPPGRDGAAFRRHPRAGGEADHRRPGSVAVPEAAAGAAHRGGPRPPQRRAVPRLHPRLPVLSGGDDHPPGPGAAGRPGPDHGVRRAGPHRVRRSGPHLPVQRRLLGHRGHGDRSSSTIRPVRARCR